MSVCVRWFFLCSCGWSCLSLSVSLFFRADGLPPTRPLRKVTWRCCGACTVWASLWPTKTMYAPRCCCAVDHGLFLFVRRLLSILVFPLFSFLALLSCCGVALLLPSALRFPYGAIFLHVCRMVLAGSSCPFCFFFQFFFQSAIVFFGSAFAIFPISAVHPDNRSTSDFFCE